MPNPPTQTPPPIRNRKGIKKKNLSGFFPQTPPCHHLLFHNDLTMKEWSSGSQSTGHHMLITNLSLQLCRIMRHNVHNQMPPFHVILSSPPHGVLPENPPQIPPSHVVICEHLASAELPKPSSTSQAQ